MHTNKVESEGWFLYQPRRAHDGRGRKEWRETILRGSEGAKRAKHASAFEERENEADIYIRHAKTHKQK